MTRKAASKRPKASGPTIAGGDLADLLDVSPTWIRKLARDNVVKRIGRNEFDLVGSVQGYLRQLIAGQAAQRPDVHALHLAREREIIQRVRMRAEKLIEAKAAAEILDDIVDLALDELDKLPGEFAKDAKTRRSLTSAVDDIRRRVTTKLDAVQIAFRTSTGE